LDRILIRIRSLRTYRILFGSGSGQNQIRIHLSKMYLVRTSNTCTCQFFYVRQIFYLKAVRYFKKYYCFCCVSLSITCSVALTQIQNDKVHILQDCIFRKKLPELDLVPDLDPDPQHCFHYRHFSNTTDLLRLVPWK
jgi:hypothetical protein